MESKGKALYEVLQKLNQKDRNNNNISYYVGTPKIRESYFKKILGR